MMDADHPDGDRGADVHAQIVHEHAISRFHAQQSRRIAVDTRVGLRHPHVPREHDLVDETAAAEPPQRLRPSTAGIVADHRRPHAACPEFPDEVGERDAVRTVENATEVEE
jgi:hypothetical protein